MATSYTSLLGFALPVTGELNGSWGDTVNNSITQLEEDAIAGVATASVTSADWTLSTTGAGATNEARKAILIPTGTPGVSRNIVAPSQSKAYIVVNQSNAAVVLKGAATSGTTIAAGKTALCAWNGSDFVTVAGNLVSLTSGVTGTLPVANGGTGAATLTGLLSGNGTSAIAPAVSGTDIKTVNSTSLLGSGNVAVQEVLVSGTNLKTVGGTTLLGSGDIAVGTGDVTLTGTQTLTNKTLTAPTITGAVLNDGYTEEVFAVSGTTPALSPTNGSIQTWTLTGNSTPTAGTWAEGQSMTLMIDDGTAFTITWTSLGVIWAGGTAPTLATTGFTVLQLWKVGSTIYGIKAGEVA